MREHGILLSLAALGLVLWILLGSAFGPDADLQSCRNAAQTPEDLRACNR